MTTIVRLAQDFVGMNNACLLEPLGQFGTRHEGGDDAASARYIYTKLRYGIFVGVFRANAVKPQHFYE